MEKSKALPVCFFDSSAFWFSLSPSYALRPNLHRRTFSSTTPEEKNRSDLAQRKDKSSTWGIIAFIKPNFFVVKPTPIRSETNSSIKAHHTTAHQKVS
jgi:hypothetical protein